MIHDSEISFVVQGPVQSTHGRQQVEGVTARCLASIRHYFPGSTIILSTWEGQPTEQLDFDLLITSSDPGPNTVFNDDEPQLLNNNRQIVSTNAGLKAVTTPYAVKIRTDNVLSGRQFLDTYLEYVSYSREQEFSYFTQRILTCSAFFIGSHYGKPVHFNKSDLFDFGLVEDLLRVWSDDLIPELTFKLKPGKKQRYPATEQFLCLAWLSKFVGRPLHINNKADDSAGLDDGFWNRFIANNIIVDSPEALGLDVTERFYKRGNLSLEYDIHDWIALNKNKKPPVDKKRIERTFKKYLGLLLRV